MVLYLIIFRKKLENIHLDVSVMFLEAEVKLNNIYPRKLIEHLRIGSLEAKF